MLIILNLTKKIKKGIKNMRAKEKPNATIIHAQDNKVNFCRIKK